jgi:hypothetical protein
MKATRVMRVAFINLERDYLMTGAEVSFGRAFLAS